MVYSSNQNVTCKQTERVRQTQSSGPFFPECRTLSTTTPVRTTLGPDLNTVAGDERFCYEGERSVQQPRGEREAEEAGQDVFAPYGADVYGRLPGGPAGERFLVPVFPVFIFIFCVLFLFLNQLLRTSTGVFLFSFSRSFHFLLLRGFPLYLLCLISCSQFLAEHCLLGCFGRR